MSVKETVHRMIDEVADDDPWLLDLYEQARLKKALDEACEARLQGRMLTWDEAERRMKEKWAQRASQSS